MNNDKAKLDALLKNKGLNTTCIFEILTNLVKGN